MNLKIYRNFQIYTSVPLNENVMLDKQKIFLYKILFWENQGSKFKI